MIEAGIIDSSPLSVHASWTVAPPAMNVSKVARGVMRRIFYTPHVRHLSAGANKRPPLQLFRSLWGVDGLDTEAGRDVVFSKLKAEGYTGVETGPFIVTASGMPKWEPDAEDQPARDAFCSSLQKHGLEMIGMIHSFVTTETPGHRVVAPRQIEAILEMRCCHFACISPHHAKRELSHMSLRPAFLLPTSLTLSFFQGWVSRRRQEACQ
jgi:hypothetical protein